MKQEIPSSCDFCEEEVFVNKDLWGKEEKSECKDK